MSGDPHPVFVDGVIPIKGNARAYIPLRIGTADEVRNLNLSDVWLIFIADHDAFYKRDNADTTTPDDDDDVIVDGDGNRWKKFSLSLSADDIPYGSDTPPQTIEEALDALQSDKANAGENTDITSLKGTVTNDDAAAGKIGEYKTASGSNVSMTNGTAKTVASISLEAGDWDVSSSILTAPANSTTQNGISFSLSLTNNTMDFNGDRETQLIGISIAAGGSFGNNAQLRSGPARFSLSTTTTIYLVGQISFAISTLTCSGKIWARRVR